MNILAVGDIVGESGLNKALDSITKIKEKDNIDFIIVNGENASGGMGITKKLFNNLINAGINVVTMGNHTWAKMDIFNFINCPNIIRPANYSRNNPGKGYRTYDCNGKKILIINLIGRTNMNVLSENPFTVVEDIIFRTKADIKILDFHAEATAEKIAMARFLDGRVNIVFGTHTHVQTADDQILPRGTAYITDIGMCGPKNSVIGMDKEASIKRFRTSLPEGYRLADGECIFNACIFKINDENCTVENIERINNL